MHESADLLVVDQLSYSYGDRVAVKSASLTCRRAEILGLLGPNGAGKTTLLSCIAGLLQGFEGQSHHLLAQNIMLTVGQEFQQSCDADSNYRQDSGK